MKKIPNISKKKLDGGHVQLNIKIKTWKYTYTYKNMNRIGVWNGNSRSIPYKFQLILSVL